ncbi:MAG: ribosome-associated translation inhibitor RaiA [Pseudomonadota bacterium]
MHIQVNGKQIDIGDSLSNHVENNLAAAVGKYFDRPADGVVTFSKDGHAFRCDATVHLATGLVAQSSATANEIYAAFDQSADRIEKQIRRYKRRLKDHHRKRERPVDAMPAPAYVLDTQSNDEDEPETLQPVIVAEMTHPVQVLSVGEAVMQMEFADKAFLIFRDDQTKRVNIVYRRDDGNVGWVDPAEAPAT